MHNYKKKKWTIILRFQKIIEYFGYAKQTYFFTSAFMINDKETSNTGFLLILGY